MGESSQKQQLPKSLYKLINAAKQRGTTLIAMPQGMSKRRINTSRFIEKADVILWRVHFVFLLESPRDVAALLRPEEDSQLNAAGGCRPFVLKAALTP